MTFTIVAATAIAVGSPAATPAPAAMPRIKIGPATTYVAGPVRTDGTINYAAALNNIVGNGVTAQNNAAIKLMPIMFRTPAAALGRHWQSKEKRIGMALGWPRMPRSERLALYIIQHAATRAAGIKRYGAMLSRVSALTNHPWTAKQQPLLARYLASQRAALAAIRKAVKRPRFFVPLTERGKISRNLTGVLFPFVVPCREIALELDRHAMLMVGEHRYRHAVGDWLAISRLAALTARQPFLLDNLVGASMQDSTDESAVDAVIALPNAVGLDKMLLRGHWPQVAKLSGVFTIGERFTLLSYIQNRAMPKRAAGAAPRGGGARNWVDWNWLCRRANVLETGFGKAAGAQNFSAWRRLATPTLRMLPKAAHPNFHGLMLPLTVTVYQQSAALMPSVAMLEFASYSARDRAHLVPIAAALALYRHAHHRFPARLSQLTPKYLKSIPADPITGKSPIYHRTPTGYSLRSVKQGTTAKYGPAPSIVCH